MVEEFGEERVRGRQRERSVGEREELGVLWESLRTLTDHSQFYFRTQPSLVKGKKRKFR